MINPPKPTGSKNFSLDFGKLPPLLFHGIFLALSLVLGGGLFLGMGEISEAHESLVEFFWGIISSWLIQFFFLECKFWAFYFRKDKSAAFQFLLLSLSFLGNLVFLWMFGISRGSNYILGFFLAYFTFLGIFVLSAILSLRLARYHT